MYPAFFTDQKSWADVFYFLLFFIYPNKSWSWTVIVVNEC